MPSDELLPIKVIFPTQQDYAPPPPGRKIPKVFGDVTPAVRQRLEREVRGLGEHFAVSFKKFPGVPAVAKVKLKADATAKSYRPSTLFNPDTCAVIGTSPSGDLLVSVTPKGVQDVANRIRDGVAKETEANISTLSSVEPYEPTDVTGGESPKSLQEHVERSKSKAVACRLFRHPSPIANQRLEAAFNQILQENGLAQSRPVYYTDDMPVYALGDIQASAIEAVAGFVGVQNVYQMPEYRLVRTAARVLGNLTADNFPSPTKGVRYGLVGLIDSGTDPNNAHLQAWVDQRVDWVPRGLQSNDHGSFVAGLLVHPRRLNHGDGRFPSVSSRVVDVVALDRDGQISEFDLITVIDKAIEKFPHVKVWNLSLSLASQTCSDRRFSQLGIALDHRVRKHGVLFVVAAGNYDTAPMRAWPAQDGLGDTDRICPPADSVRSITVGSVTHLENNGTRVRVEQPSPFSRRGPAPAYLIKPELVHYGGNCDEQGRYTQVGVVSLDHAGHLCENIGTSFATPLVSTLTASVWDELAVDPSAVSPALVKAMLVHAAFLRGGSPSTETVNYRGLGVPPDAPEILACRQSAATIVLQVPIKPNPQFAKTQFQLVEALEQDGHLRGEVFMTLVHDTPLDPNFGPEYCRSNVTVSLGTPRANSETGKLENHREVEPVPKSLTEGYETDLVKHGFKWSPLKLYYRKFSRVPAGKSWRLLIDRLDRAEAATQEHQGVVLLVTVRHTDPEVRVYDRVAQMITRLGWTAQDLQVRSRVRLRG